MDAMAQKRADLKKLLAELSAFQEKVNKGETPDQATADAMDGKVAEVETLQKEIDQHDARMAKIGTLRTEGAKLVNPVIPDDEPAPAARAQGKREDVVGYMTVGDFAIAQGALQKWEQGGRQKVSFKLADVPSLLRKRGQDGVLVPLDRKTVDRMYEAKAVPTLGAGVIEPDRIPGIVRVTEHDMLVLRDILNIVPTNSDTVYWERLTSYTRAADRTAHGAVKPEASMAVGTASATVDTIAVHIPVNNQQLADYPALAGLINGELLYDLDKRVEELIVWGDGVASNFLGFALDPAIQAFRTEPADTLIDVARRGITDVRRDGYQPNYFLIDPLDWEDIVLEKGTDNRYVWVVVTEGSTHRLWSVPVVETVACEDSMDTMARVMIVGDFRVGATLYDRMQSQVSVGWIDDQFIRNRQTILAELRAAWAIRRPDAFRVHETQAGTS